MADDRPEPTHGIVDDVAPGSSSVVRESTIRARRFSGYLIGLALAALLTAARSRCLHTRPDLGAGHSRWRWSCSASRRSGVHLVFFLHITTAPDNTNNVLALAFGVLIVALRDWRLALDHGAPEPEHDAAASDHADAALSVATAAKFRQMCASAASSGYRRFFSRSGLDRRSAFPMALYFLRLLLIDTREFSACVRLSLEQLVELGVNGLGIAVLSRVE